MTTEHAEPASPYLERQTTLKDALSLLLSADVLAGVVVDDQRRLLGVLTLDQIAAVLRDAARQAPAKAAS